MSLYRELRYSYKELDEFNLNFVSVRIRAGAKISRERLLEVSYSEEDYKDGRELGTSRDYSLFREIEKHNKLHDYVIIRIRVSQPLYQRLQRENLTLELGDTLMTGTDDREFDRKHGYWSI